VKQPDGVLSVRSTRIRQLWSNRSELR